MSVVQFKRLDHGIDLALPSYETEGAAGMDLRAAFFGRRLLLPGETLIVETGFQVALEHGWEMQIRPRSGLAAKHGITVLNSPGTIDSDYRGEIKVILINHGEHSFAIDRGDRIAQGVLCPTYRATIYEVEELAPTDRGEGGFGSTGTS